MALAIAAVVLIGCGLLVYGLSLVWLPLAFIAAGLFTIVLAVLLWEARKQLVKESALRR